VIKGKVSLDATPAGAPAFTSKRPPCSPDCDFSEIRRLSDMPQDLIVWFEKSANAVFAGDMPRGGNRHEHTLRAMRG
jgi:hypothetical protein